MINIFGTLGPQCSSEETLYKMILAGMTGLRIDLTRKDLPDYTYEIHNYQQAAKRAGCQAALLIDLEGPEAFDSTPVSDEQQALSEVPALSVRDRANLRLIPEYGVTGVIQPFVRSADDLHALRSALRENNCGHCRIYGKIESAAGLASMPEIIAAADEIIIARGDLGRSMPLWQLPATQKRIARACNDAGRDFMVVNQMLATLQFASEPTRAEVGDIFNAVLDGAASLMVTSETAQGYHPVRVIEYLTYVAEEACHYRQTDLGEHSGI